MLNRLKHNNQQRKNPPPVSTRNLPRQLRNPYVPSQPILPTAEARVVAVHMPNNLDCACLDCVNRRNGEEAAAWAAANPSAFLVDIEIPIASPTNHKCAASPTTEQLHQGFASVTPSLSQNSAASAGGSSATNAPAAAAALAAAAPTAAAPFNNNGSPPSMVELDQMFNDAVETGTKSITTTRVACQLLWQLGVCCHSWRPVPCLTTRPIDELRPLC